MNLAGRDFVNRCQPDSLGKEDWIVAYLFTITFVALVPLFSI